MDNIDSHNVSLNVDITREIPTLRGSNVLLSPMMESDVTSSYLEWLSNPKINRFLETRFQDHTLDSLREFVRGFQDNPNSILFKIELVDSLQHVGNVKLGPIDWNHGFADTGILIGDESLHGRGIGTEVIVLIRDYAFHELSLRKLMASAYEENVGSIKLYQRAGFEIEGVRKRQYELDGDYTGLVLMGCRKEMLND